jgi:ApaG protein
MFQARTRDIKIEVEPSYVKEQSDPNQAYYFFSYRVRISNESQGKVQLLSRHWIITDGFGQIEEVVGPGVLGQQPTLGPGEVFEYSSFCPLATPTGSMHGTYVMVDAAGIQLEVQIPKFILAEPTQYH